MRAKRRGLTAAFLALAALAASGCGAPAVVKPASTPIGGLVRDVQAAHSVVAQSEAQAQAQTGATLP
jgi:hypothetical protein